DYNFVRLRRIAAAHGIELPSVCHESPMKLLIVEDQPKTGQYLRQGLSEAGFNAELVADGTTGQHLALTGDYALLTLDVMLPGRNGWQILQAVRSAALDMPVLFLTARDAV